MALVSAGHQEKECSGDDKKARPVSERSPFMS